MNARVCKTLGIAVFSLFSLGASYAHSPVKVKPFSVDVRPNGTTKVSYANATDGSVESTMWRTRSGQAMSSKRNVAPDGTMTWTRAASLKNHGPLARLTGNKVSKGELHYLAQQDGRSSPADARREAAKIAAQKHQGVLLHVNGEVVPIHE